MCMEVYDTHKHKINGCLIAAVAGRTGVPVLYKDADFEAIAACVELRQRSVR